MSNFAWFVILFFSLFIVGLLGLALMVGKYYWGPRQGPPTRKNQAPGVDKPDP